MRRPQNRSFFTSDLFIQPGDSKPVNSDDMSGAMIELYRAAGIFAGEGPVRRTTRRLEKLGPETVFPMHGPCIDKATFPKYADAITGQEFAYTDRLCLAGRWLETQARKKKS